VKKLKVDLAKSNDEIENLQKEVNLGKKIEEQMKVSFNEF